MELLLGIEPKTSSLPRKCSTAELQQRPHPRPASSELDTSCLERALAPGQLDFIGGPTVLGPLPEVPAWLPPGYPAVLGSAEYSQVHDCCILRQSAVFSR